MAATAAYAAAILAGAGVLLLRQRGAGAIDTLWGEDGAIFLADVLHHPVGEPLLRAYNGYAHLVPRLIAEVAEPFPLEAAASVFAVGSALLTAGLAAVVYRASAAILRRRVVRFGVAASVVLLPVAGYETANNAANLHWYLLFAAFWVLLWRPPAVAGRLVAATVCLLAALSDPLAVLLVPVALAPLLSAAVPRLRSRMQWHHDSTREDRVDWAAGVGLLVGLGIQSFIVVTSSSPLPYRRGPVPGLLQTFGVRTVLSSLLGNRMTVAIWNRIGLVAAVAAMVVLVGVIAVVWSVAKPHQRRVIALAVPLSFAAMAAAFELRWIPGGLPTAQTGQVLEPGSRYSVLPILLLLVVIAVGVDRGLDRGGRAAPLACAVLGGWFLIVAAVDFRLANAREHGPRWSAEVGRAALACADPNVHLVSVPITPPPGWAVAVPCHALR